jgi:hypothetical protein
VGADGVSAFGSSSAAVWGLGGAELEDVGAEFGGFVGAYAGYGLEVGEGAGA